MLFKHTRRFRYRNVFTQPEKLFLIQNETGISQKTPVLKEKFFYFIKKYSFLCSQLKNVCWQKISQSLYMFLTGVLMIYRWWGTLFEVGRSPCHRPNL